MVCIGRRGVANPKASSVRVWPTLAVTAPSPGGPKLRAKPFYGYYFQILTGVARRARVRWGEELHRLEAAR